MFQYKHSMFVYETNPTILYQHIYIHANPVFWEPISWRKVFWVLRPLPNRKRNNKRFLDMGLYNKPV